MAFNLPPETSNTGRFSFPTFPSDRLISGDFVIRPGLHLPATMIQQMLVMFSTHYEYGYSAIGKSGWVRCISAQTSGTSLFLYALTITDRLNLA
jgi:hypothetical protein